MNFFKTCFTASKHDDFDFEKDENPHQRLQREDTLAKISLKDTDDVPNVFEARGAWRHRGEQIDFTPIAHKQMKYK